MTSANVHDATMVPKQLTGDETVMYGDSGYFGTEKRDTEVCKTRLLN